MAESMHKFSVLDAVEAASTALRTDYAKQKEAVVIGFPLRGLLTTLPQFTEIEPKEETEGGPVLIGNIGRRKVFVSYKLEDNGAFYLKNDAGTCTITVVDIDPQAKIREALALFNEAKECNPYLYFELAWSKATGWDSWLIDCTGGERKVLANDQDDSGEPGAEARVCEVIIEALKKWLLENNLTPR